MGGARRDGTGLGGVLQGRDGGPQGRDGGWDSAGTGWGATGTGRGVGFRGDGIQGAARGGRKGQGVDCGGGLPLHRRSARFKAHLVPSSLGTVKIKSGC